MISDEDEEILDIEWFAADANGAVGRFRTGGQGFIPLSIKNSQTDLAIVAAFINDVLPVRCAPILSGYPGPHLGEHQVYDGERFKDFHNKMASKGVYSFCCVVANHRPVNYFLVAKPASPITLPELPDKIPQLLDLTLACLG